MNTPDKVIAIATSELNYLEKSASAYKKNPSVLYSKSDGKGYDNYTKFGKEMHAIYPQVMDFPAAWCDAFVDWCFYKAYGTATAKSLLNGNFDDYTVASAQMYAKHGAIDYSPRVGDQVFFTTNGKVSGCYHTGLVVKVDRDYVYTIEGNTSPLRGIRDNGGGVYEKKYLLKTYKNRLLFAHPAYDKVTADTSKKVSAPSKVPQYVAKVNVSKLNVRSWAGTEYPQIKSYPQLAKDNMVDVCDQVIAKNGGLWSYVRIQGRIYGFVYADYLTRV